MKKKIFLLLSLQCPDNRFIFCCKYIYISKLFPLHKSVIVNMFCKYQLRVSDSIINYRVRISREDDTKIVFFMAQFLGFLIKKYIFHLKSCFVQF